MERNFIFRVVLFVAIVICGISAVPLTNIISKSMKEVKFSAQGKPLSQRTPYEPEMLTPENHAHEINTPSERFPSPNDVTEHSSHKLFTGDSNVGLLRSRRQADNTECVVAPGSPVVDNLEDLNLNFTTFLGLTPVHADKPVFGDQLNPRQCPTKDELRYHNEDNLRSTCPWIWAVKDLTEQYGNDIYPRFITEARCLPCQNCIGSAVNKCHELRHTVTAFQKIGCHSNGLAIMLKKTVYVTAGCYCKKPESDSVFIPDTDLPPTSD